MKDTIQNAAGAKNIPAKMEAGKMVGRPAKKKTNEAATIVEALRKPPLIASST